MRLFQMVSSTAPAAALASTCPKPRSGGTAVIGRLLRGSTNETREPPSDNGGPVVPRPVPAPRLFRPGYSSPLRRLRRGLRSASSGAHLAIHRHDRGEDRLRPCAVAHPTSPRVSDSLSPRAVLQERANPSNQGRGVPGFHDDSPLAAVQEFWNPSYVRRDDGPLARHCLQDRQRVVQDLAGAFERGYEEVCGPEERLHIRHDPHLTYGGVEAEALDQTEDVVPPVSVPLVRFPPGGDEDCLRVRRSDVRHRMKQALDPFPRGVVPDEQDDRSPLGRAQAPPRLLSSREASEQRRVQGGQNRRHGLARNPPPHDAAPKVLARNDCPVERLQGTTCDPPASEWPRAVAVVSRSRAKVRRIQGEDHRDAEPA